MNKQQPVLSEKDVLCKESRFSKALLILTLVQTVVCSFVYVMSTVENVLLFILTLLLIAGLVLVRVLWDKAPVVRRVLHITYITLAALAVGFALFSLLLDLSAAEQVEDTFIWWSLSLYGCWCAVFVNMLLVFLLPVMAASAAHGLLRDQWILRIALLLNLPLTALTLLYSYESFGFPTYNETLLPLGDFMPVGLILTVLAGVTALLSLLQYMAQNKTAPQKKDVS